VKKIKKGKSSMSRRAETSALGLKPHFKVRVVLPNVVLHLASWTEPRVDINPYLVKSDGKIENVKANWIDDHNYGDTVGRIYWPAVTAITWRWSE